VSRSTRQVRIELTPDQKAQISKATTKTAKALELSVEELEERIVPSTIITRKAGGTGPAY
jgi:hypothetical protein